MPKTQFHHKHPRKKLKPKRLLVLIVALVMTFLLLMSVIGLAQKYFALRKRIRELQKEQVTLQTKKNNLSVINTYLQTPEGSEQALRDKYNLVKPGEGIVIITLPDTGNGTSKKQSRVARWWEAIVQGLGIHK